MLAFNFIFVWKVVYEWQFFPGFENKIFRNSQQKQFSETIVSCVFPKNGNINQKTKTIPTHIFQMFSCCWSRTLFDYEVLPLACRNARGVLAKEQVERRLSEAVELLNLITNG